MAPLKLLGHHGIWLALFVSELLTSISITVYYIYNRIHIRLSIG